jgi:hypothetical protein
VLIEDYFQKIEADISGCPYGMESRLFKDKRSVYIGIIEGDITFIDESILHFIEFVNVREGIEIYNPTLPVA